jgi:hypothetical protein
MSIQKKENGSKPVVKFFWLRLCVRQQLPDQDHSINLKI